MRSQPFNPHRCAPVNEVSALRDNLQALLSDLQKAKPAASKGIYLKRITLSSTMGPGVPVDQASLGLG